MSNKIIHKHSSVVTDGNPKIPTSSQLDYGELAINYADGVETISFKNSNNEIVEIKTKNYFDNQINSNSEKIQALEDSYDLIVSEIENNELVTATAITNLEERTTNVENGLTEKSDVGHTHTSADISDSISAKSGVTSTATGLVQGKAVYDYAPPKSHASSSTTYGVATTANYGHVKISNGDVATVTNANGLAAGMDHTHSNYSTTGHTHGTITLSGDVTGSASIGSGTTAVNITATVTNNSHTHTSANISDSISAASGVTSAATGLVQGKVIYNLLTELKSVIEDNELVTASAITNIEERIKYLENKIKEYETN